MSSLKSSSPSSSFSGHKYHVFLSFRGKDTRKQFTDHLDAALKRKGILTFKDNPNLEPGEEVRPELLKAIQESWCSVIVFSETYASSSWCLDELAEIVKQKNERGHNVFPIFYEVDPSDLKKQTGKVAEAFAEHEKRYKEEKIRSWRIALTEVAAISGWVSKNKHESEFIQDIVEKIYSVVQLTGPLFHSKDFKPSESPNLTFNQIIMSSLPSSSPPSSISGHKYDVFLSFRGEGAPKQFTYHLDAALKRKGILTFKDNPNLEPGEEVRPELLKAIQESWCSVIVFSETYASSSWCLDMLAEILKQKNERGHNVFPVFYKVDPSHLRYQNKGKAAKAFAEHVKRYKENRFLHSLILKFSGRKDKIQRWRTALTEVANIPGWDSRNKHESQIIEDIVERIFSRMPPKLIGPIVHSKDFMPSNSSNLTFSQIIKALNTKGVNLIGLYGMAGVGKTTLTKQVLMHVKEKKLFDNAVMVTMSQNPNINNIQDRIAELLGLKFEASTEGEKAAELWQRLKCVDKVLIIIDDVWEAFELSTIGIPSSVEHEGCKILLTTRLHQVCVRMKCQEKFQLNVLSEDEAWALFKDKADLKDSNSTLNAVAKEVASECKGLPLAIAAIGTALKGESVHGWIAANKRFKDNDNEDVCEVIFNRLQLSYDYLEGDNIRSCFLLCSLFPEDFRIGIEPMVILGIGLGLFSGTYLMGNLRMEIRVALRKLQDYGLLLKSDDDGDDDDNDNEEYVRMHYMVRDFAHWITLKEKDMYMVKEGLMEWPSEPFECCAAISFWRINSIDNFPKKLEFSKLKILIFQGNKLVKIPEAFFEGMKDLRVLRFKNVSVEVLKFMTNLQALCLEDCELDIISSLGNMKNLEMLALKDTNIFELPGELVTLHELKSLHVSFSRGQQGNFPPNLLSRLMSLQELHVTCKNNVNLLELNSLAGLTAVSLRVSTNQFPKNFVFPKLQSYIIAINQRLRFMMGLKFRTLRIDNMSSSLSAFKELFCNVEKLTLEFVEEHKNIVPSIDEKGLNEVTALQLEGCSDMECLMDTTGEEESTTAFSNLEKLKMGGMNCLKELYLGSPPINFLQKLKDVSIEDCRELKAVFTKAQSLLHLQQLRICFCDGLENIFDFSQEMAELQVHPLSNLTSLELESLIELKLIWKGPTSHLVSLKSLKTVRIDGCLKLVYLFQAPLAQTLEHLEVLHLYGCDSLEHIIMEEAENEDEIASNMDSYTLRWPKLRTIKIRNCKSLKHLFPMTLAKELQNLETIDISDCPELKLMFNETRLENEDEIVSKLKTIKIWNCKSLKHLFPTNLAQEFQYLEHVEIVDCPELNQEFRAARLEFHSRQLSSRRTHDF